MVADLLFHPLVPPTTLCASPGGSDDWGLSEAMAAFTQLPALHHLLVRFRYDTEAPPKDLSERCSAMRGGLRHLSLIMPARSALPPMVELAQGLSELTQVGAGPRIDLPGPRVGPPLFVQLPGSRLPRENKFMPRPARAWPLAARPSVCLCEGLFWPTLPHTAFLFLPWPHSSPP